MKKLLTNLLMVVALALCAIVAVQWVREAHLRQQVHDLLHSGHEHQRVLQDLNDQLKRSEDEVARLEKLKNSLVEEGNTNALLTLDLRKQLDQVRVEAERQARSAESYKSALQQANQNITKQNDDIRKQNDELKKLAQDRNDTVAKYNKLAKDFDALAKKWNNQQEELSRRPSKQ